MRIKSLGIRRRKYLIRCTRWKNNSSKYRSPAYVRHSLVGRELFRSSVSFRCVKSLCFVVNVKTSNPNNFIFWNLRRYAVST